METGSPPLSACVSCHRSFHQGYTLGLVPGQGAGLCPEWDDGPEQPSTISDPVWQHGIPSRNPLTEQGGAQGGTGWGREGGEEAEVVEIGEFATVGEGGMEETGEEDGGHGGGWRSPLT